MEHSQYRNFPTYAGYMFGAFAVPAYAVFFAVYHFTRTGWVLIPLGIALWVAVHRAHRAYLHRVYEREMLPVVSTGSPSE